MREMRFKIRFLTPAFLGDADQKAQWRTPPFKAELRRWWRVVHAARLNFRVDDVRMRQREGEIFGTAHEKNHSKSLLKIRLSRWDKGGLTSWSGFLVKKIRHPEVKPLVDPHLYLGYGPLLYKGGGTKLKSPPAIGPGEECELRLRIPEQYRDEIETALELMNRFGSVGGRSRNGWGAFELRPSDHDDLPYIQLCNYCQDWQEALDFDWPHAIGMDGRGPLVWKTKGPEDWKELMRTLAEIKVGFRTKFRFTSGDNAPFPEDRHWLAYPVTKHSVDAWGRSKRLPNALRFTVKSGGSGQVCGIIYHMPWSPTKDFSPDRGRIRSVWQRVHEFLDKNEKLTRYEEGGCLS